MVMHDAKVVSERLEASRGNLLDTSRRNRLINYRPSKTAGVEIVGEDPFELYRLLVIEQKAMKFSGKEDPPKPETGSKPAGQETLYVDSSDDAVAMYEHRVKAEEELAGFLGYEELPTDQTDTVLNTHEYFSRLKVLLLKTYRDARTIIEESGVNVLFLALGSLTWQEQEGEKAERRSPLVLIPVQLEPVKDGSYRLRHDGGEVGGNLSLQAMMQAEFGIEIPSLPDSELDLRAYFAQVRKAVSTKPSWKVDDRQAVVGFFSYAKYLLYMDLAEDKWPNGAKPSEHEVMGSLLDTAFLDPEPGLPDDEPLDRHRPISEIHDVIGSDGSQALAILEAASGQSMVIQGPPGTGKSQTITNLIADALARGKRVLFVAEKMAALDVVARNLGEAGLRDACLELHSQKTKKAEFYAELRRVQELAAPHLAQGQAELEMLEARREELNEYCEAINQPIEGRQLSPRDAMGKLVQLGAADEGLCRMNFDMMTSWNEDRFKTLMPLVHALERKVAEIGPPKQNRFFGSRMTLLLGMDIGQLFRSVGDTLGRVNAAAAVGNELAETLKILPAAKLNDLTVIARSAKRAADAPRLEGVAVNTGTWVDHEPRLRAALASGAKVADLHRKYEQELLVAAWETEIGATRAALIANQHKWYRIFIGDFRRACKHIDSLSVTPGGSLSKKIELVEAITEAQSEVAKLNSADALCRGTYGVQWEGINSDWNALTRLTDWVVDLHRSIGSGELPPGLLQFFDGKTDKVDLSARAEQVLGLARAATEALTALARSLEFPSVPPSLETSLAECIHTLQGWENGQEELDRLVGFNKLMVEAEKAGLTEAASLASEWTEANARLVEAFTRTWYEGVLREAFAARPPLQRFDRLRHEESITIFRRLDSELLKLNQSRIRVNHYRQVPRSLEGGAAAKLQHQMGLRTRHMPIRRAMSETGSVIQAIKPVFMMSPLSVAMYLPPDGPKFDLVIFDEASQVKPEDAFGAILRAKQVIVVGDSKQMPPTSFFDKLTSGDDATDEQEEDRNTTRDMESVLSLMDSKIGPASPRRRDLRWHYRSRHLSLIAPSNALFYNYRLFLFPNPEPPSGKLGLQFHYRADSVYDRGASRTNRIEAKDVAQAVQRHVHDNPGESLMVVAFSQAQQQAIQDEIDLLVKGDPAFDTFATLHPNERLDVKNLENVQGDERDVIFISVGYGKDAKGFTSMSFGPLNGEGGERRLNVLITRAKVRCEVFTNLRGEDIRVEGSASAGIHALKEFLTYAETLRMNSVRSTGLAPMSPFEEAVIDKLRLHGYEVEPQVGSAGFFIDIGVKDPDKPSRFILGIECDGAQYHSSRTARDRDKLRQMVLEDRGWRIHRVWSTDWWSHPDRELRRCIEAIEQARVGRSLDATVLSNEQPAEVVETPLVQPPPEVPELERLPDYQFAKLSVPSHLPLHELNPKVMADLVRQVAEVESPVHIDEVVRRIREAADLGRAGTRIREAVEAGIRTAAAAGVQFDGSFLSVAGREVKLRSRAHFPSQFRKLEWIADSELALAVLEVVDRSFRISISELSARVPRLIGFDRATAAMRARVAGVVQGLVKDGRLKTVGESVSLG